MILLLVCGDEVIDFTEPTLEEQQAVWEEEQYYRYAQEAYESYQAQQQYEYEQWQAEEAAQQAYERARRGGW